MIGHDYNHVPTAPERMDHSRCEPHHRSDLQAARIIRRAQRGDAAAFESIYRMYSRRVYSLCLHMIGNPAEAEDLSQEAFLRVFRKIQTFRGESAFSTWLHRLATNVVLMHLRKWPKFFITTPEMFDLRTSCSASTSIIHYRNERCNE